MTSTTLRLEKVPVVDCRAVHGFLGTPVDGSAASWGYRGEVTEYPFTGRERYDAGTAVAYAYNDNDGLHMELADDGGFDLVVVRGGARTRLYGGDRGLLEPAGEGVQVARFDAVVRERRVSFFGTCDGFLADVGFYRTSDAPVDVDGSAVWTPRGEAQLEPPEAEFAPESLYRAMEEAGLEPAYRPLVEGDGGDPVLVAAGHTAHWIGPPEQVGQGLRAVVLEAAVSGAGDGLCTVVVKDPLNPRLDLVHVPVPVRGGQALRLVLDLPPQVLLPGARLWVAVTADRDLRLAGPEGGAPRLRFVHAPEQDVRQAAFAHRMFLLRSYFCIGSEARQWGGYRRREHQASLARMRYGRQYAELFMTLDQCHELNPDDDRLRQYREWVYLRSLDALRPVPAPAGPPDGVPAWAWYARQGWLEVRRIVEWWLDHRLVPTGEFGGIVGDDSDYYQQLADLPYLEDGGVGARLRDGAAAFADLAWTQNLEGGINRLTTDSLHAYEEGINHLALTSRWFDGDPIHFERCLASARNMVQLTVRSDDGRRLFRDSRLLGTGQIEDPQTPGADGGSAALMWHTTLQAADASGDVGMLGAVTEWADTWLRLMQPGAYATAVDVVSGEVKQSSPARPFEARGQEPVAQWLHALTGDRRFVEPVLRLCRVPDLDGVARASLSDLYNTGALDDLDPEALARLAAHDPALGLFVHHDPEPIVERIIGQPEPGGSAISCLYDAARWPHMFTEAEQYTDRIFFNRLLRWVSLCYLGGSCSRGDFHPTAAVSWEGFGTDFAALVLDNRRDRLAVVVYSFADDERRGAMRLWRLDHGRYQVRSGVDTNGDFHADEACETRELELARADRVPVTLRPGAVTVLRLRQVEALDPVHARPDLALAARETRLQGDAVTGVVHNIGAAAVEDVVVGLVDAEGRVLVRQALGPLESPHDLWPKTVAFSLCLPGPRQKGWELVVDPDDTVPEIRKHNNRVALDSLRESAS